MFKQFGMAYDPNMDYEYAEMPLDQLFSQHHKGCTCEYRDFVTMTIAAYERNMKSEANIFPDVPLTLGILRSNNRRLGIVSRSYEHHIRMILSDFSMEDAFDSIVGLERAVLQRPNPYTVDLCMREMGADRNNTLLVSSNPLDIETGHNAGVKTALLDRSGHTGPDCGPTYYISSFDEILKL
ncbi:putative phosphatase [Thermoplasmatales archaeon BRNA1]|nr:putative phosphatase [Thermoplasmatales archaeon BRNA1]